MMTHSQTTYWYHTLMIGNMYHCMTVSGNNNDTIKVDNGDRAFTGNEEMHLETTREGTRHLGPNTTRDHGNLST